MPIKRDEFYRQPTPKPEPRPVTPAEVIAKLKEAVEPARKEIAPRVLAHLQTAPQMLFEYEELRKACLPAPEAKEGQLMAATVGGLASIALFTYVLDTMVESGEVHRHQVEKEEGEGRAKRKTTKVAYSLSP